MTGRVTDAARVIGAGERTRITRKLEALERRTGHQLVVATVPGLDGRPVDAYSRDLANAWGIGRKGVDDGVVLLVAPHEHKVRIEVGKGLEATLPDATCRQILERQVLPRFRAGDLAGGIDAGVDALVARLG